jgi:hypothetical protein
MVSNSAPATQVFEHMIGSQLFCRHVGSFPVELTIRREDPKRMDDILQFVLFFFASAPLRSQRNVLT